MNRSVDPSAGAATGARQNPDLPWVRLGRETVLLARDEGEETAARQARTAGATPHVVVAGGDGEDFHLVTQIGRLFQRAHPDVPVLHDRGRYLIVSLDRARATAIGVQHEEGFEIRPLPANTVVFDVRQPAAVRTAPLAWVQALVDRLDRPALEADLEHLASFPTRLSTSSHFADAATWAREQLQAAGYTARLEPVAVGGGTTQNVIVERDGSGAAPRGLVIICAHLDSINLVDGPAGAAPGADDNASGSAGLLAMARALAGHAGVHDLRLILFGGEEQGLFGSRAYVAALAPADRQRLRAAVNMDMIGTLNTPAPAVLLEGAEVSRSLVEALSTAAATYAGLDIQVSFQPFGSDHIPFIDAGLPAVLTIEGTDSANPNEHTAGDTLAHISYELILEILRMNVAFVATALERTA